MMCESCKQPHTEQPSGCYPGCTCQHRGWDKKLVILPGNTDSTEEWDNKTSGTFFHLLTASAWRLRKATILIKRVFAGLSVLLASLCIFTSQAFANPVPVPSGTSLAQQHYTLSVKEPDRTYVVRKNDTLSSIGKKQHIRWQSIYCANRKKLHYQVNLIYPGQILILKNAHCKLPSSGAPSGGSTGNNPPVPQGSAQRIAQSLLNSKGWGSQYGCLAAIINYESGWNIHATNPYSGAYGIPQALPGSKMSVAGSDWQTSAYTQLKWMIDYYIGPVYGTPCQAWSYELAHGSY